MIADGLACLGGAAFIVSLWLLYRRRYAGRPLRDPSLGVFEFMPVVLALLRVVGLPVAVLLTIVGVAQVVLGLAGVE